MIQDIIDTHQGLGFLRDAPEFHSRYITTVVSRIFYKVNRSWSGRITLSELRRSNLLQIIKRLEEETDINNVTEYFSYEHFYVIYCKFWELDKDHDLLIDKTDLRGHADHALSGRIIERIFSGTVLRGWDMTSTVRAPSDKMTYSDFVWFLLSEEDKKTQTAIEYWFRCLDLDGDGVLSPFELQYFYCEQETRIEAIGIEPLDFANVYCQVVDMLQCSSTGIRLKDFKRNPQLAANVFNTLFNLDKYLEHEQRDPFAAAASGASNPDGFEAESDWDKFAAAEYELLIAEETPSDQCTIRISRKQYRLRKYKP
jgi:serine/threonine-protein phosphatase 2A regulatory subunit B''